MDGIPGVRVALSRRDALPVLFALNPMAGKTVRGCVSFGVGWLCFGRLGWGGDDESRGCDEN